MASESDLYSHTLYGARHLQSLEAYSFNTLLPNWRERPSVRSWTPEGYFERVIKIHALFGGRITITSITPIGSTVLLSLFAKPDFQAFLGSHPSFLDFCSNFGGDTRIEQALSGLRRATRSDWVSSLFSEVELPRNLGTEIVSTAARTILETTGSSTSIDPRLAEDRLTGALSRFRDDNRVRNRQFEILKAVPKVLDHFLNNDKTHVYHSAKDYERQPVLKVIEESLKQSGLNERELEKLQSVQNIIASRCDPGASFSEIITAIESASDLGEAEKKIVLQTACYAYNHDLEDAIAVRFRSQIKLPAGVPVGIRRGGIHNVVVTSTDNQQIKTLGQYLSNIIAFDCDLDHIGWHDIEEAMKVSDIARSAVYFQNHLLDLRPDYEAARYCLEQHTEKLTTFLRDRKVFPPPPDKKWLVLFGGGLGFGLGLTIGQYLPNMIVPTQTGFGGAMLTGYAIERAQDYAAYEMLREAAEQEFLAEHR